MQRFSAYITCVLGFILAVCFTLSSCEEGTSHLSQKDMAELMYDLHCAQAVASEYGDSTAYYEKLLCDAVLRKHGLTQENLDDNLHYYTSRPEEFYKVYEKLSSRFDDGGGAGGMMMESFGSSDTLNIWPDVPRVLLVNKGRNRVTVKFEIDTIVKPGDNLELIFQASNIYSEGERNLEAFVKMEYADSVATQSMFIGGVGYQQETLQHNSGRLLKSISVTFLQNTLWSEKVKLLMLNNIHILRLRQKTEPQIESLVPDSLTTEDVDSAEVQTASRAKRPQIAE